MIDFRQLGVVVTGAGSGLGRATADHLERCGATVVGLDQQFDDPADGRVRFTADITSWEAVDAAFDAITERHQVDAVVHCAGVAAGFRLLGRQGAADPERFRRVIEVNLLGAFHVVRSAARCMQSNPLRDDQRGVIVLTSSIAAFEGQQGQVAYAASKAGVVGMTLPAARDLGEYGIRCVTIAPGAFETKLTTELDAGLQERLVSTAALPRRLGRPEEFAALVEAAIANPMLNGEVIRLDGGNRLGPA